MTHSASTSRGFTLIEVLAALLLMGLVLPVAMRGVTLSLQTASQARHRLEATQLAQQKIAEFLVVRDASQFNGAGTFRDAWPQYRWRSRGTFAGYGVYEVVVTVTWPRRGGEDSLQLATLVYPLTGTDQADPAEEVAP